MWSNPLLMDVNLREHCTGEGIKCSICRMPCHANTCWLPGAHLLTLLWTKHLKIIWHNRRICCCHSTLKTMSKTPETSQVTSPWRQEGKVSAGIWAWIKLGNMRQRVEDRTSNWQSIMKRWIEEKLCKKRSDWEEKCLCQLEDEEEEKVHVFSHITAGPTVTDVQAFLIFIFTHSLSDWQSSRQWGTECNDGHDISTCWCKTSKLTPIIHVFNQLHVLHQ